MTRYERRVISMDDDGGFDIEGRIVTVLGAPREGLRSVTALVELPDDETHIPTTFDGEAGRLSGAEPAGVPADADRDESGEAVFEDATCAGKDGECSRTVSEPGDYCWQHDES